MTQTTPHPDMPTRQIHLDLSRGFPRYWNNNDPVLSIAFDTLSMMFPRGEQEFIDSVRINLKKLPPDADPLLIQDCKKFMAQEATHRHLHAQFNQVLKSQDYENLIEKSYEPMDRYAQKKGADRIENLLPDRLRLVATVCFEHFTAMLTDVLLKDGRFIEHATPDMKLLWTWHSVEETEHKAVAFNLYQELYGSNPTLFYLERVSIFILASLWFNVDWIRVTLTLLHRDGQLGKWSTWKQFFKLMGQLQYLTAKEWSRFFKPNFHPWQHDNRGLIETWKHQHQDAFTTIS